MHPGNRYPQVAKAAATAAPALAHSHTITADYLVACGTTRAKSLALSLCGIASLLDFLDTNKSLAMML